MAKSSSKKIALCGLLCALAITILFFSSLIGIGIYAGPMVASFALVIVTKEYGTKYSLLCYAAVSIISVLILPDRELTLFFVFFGWYQAVLPYINRIKLGALKIIIKLGIYSVSILTMYGLVVQLLGIYIEENQLFWLNALLFILGAAMFLFMDVVYDKILLLWNSKWRKILLK